LSQKDNPNGTFELSTLNRIVDDYCNWATDVTVVPDEDAIISMLYEGNLVFEGAQGVLLDQLYGFKPHNTWSNTTFSNAYSLLSCSEDKHDISRVGVLRCYSTRHGAGPMVTEDRELKVPIDKTNVPNYWQGTFRVGHFDMTLARYALETVGGVDELVLSCMDHISSMPKYQVCEEYDLKGRLSDSLLKWAKPIMKDVEVNDIIPYLRQALNTHIRLVSFGPTYKDKKEIN
jgi:adenylosuccinate synthase